MRPFLDYVTVRTTDRRDTALMADVRAAETEALREALRKTRLLLGHGRAIERNEDVDPSALADLERENVIQRGRP